MSFIHTRSPYEADRISDMDLQAERDRRSERERFAPIEPWVDPERHRRFEAYQCARLRNEDLGVLLYNLISLRKAAVDADADDVTPIVQQWIDKYQPIKTAAEKVRDELAEAVTTYKGGYGERRG